MGTQLPLDLETSDRFSRERLVVQPALSDVLEVLLKPESWLGAHVILQGAEGTGKTHLAHVFSASIRAHFLTSQETFGLDLGSLGGSYVVDDAETANEEALFHLSNHVQRSNQFLVLTTKKQPITWETMLPDLASRLRAMRLVVLPEPDDQLLVGVLRKLFTERAISPSEDTLDYLARRIERSVPAAQKIVTELEYYANGRAFNKALVRDFLEQTETLFDDPGA